MQQIATLSVVGLFIVFGKFFTNHECLWKFSFIAILIPINIIYSIIERIKQRN